MTSESCDEATFCAGAALASLHPIARSDHPLGSLWRYRLSLANAAVLARRSGRTDDEAALRDAWYLRRTGDDPGPAGRILKAWRFLSERNAMTSHDRAQQLCDLFELRPSAALSEVIAQANRLIAGQGSAIAAAGEIAAASMRLIPQCEPLSLWLADLVLAQRLNWPMAVPMIASQIRRGDLRAATKDGAFHDVWHNACALAYARAAASAVDLYADLSRRADRLLAAAPKLRAKDADAMVSILMREDAQPAGTGLTASDRSTRRLFERLVSLGAVRELTGRPTFRLYGL